MKTVRMFFRSYNIATILHDKPLDDTRPYVNIKINDITASGLLDSGAAVIILGNNAHNVLVKQGLQICTDNIISVIAAGGQTFDSLGYINLPIRFEDNFHKVKAHVVPEVKSSLILGIDFWRAFKLCPKYLGSLQLARVPLMELNANIQPSFINSYDNLNDSQRAIADSIVEQFKDISYEHKVLGRTHLISHCIDTGDSPPVRQRYYRLSPEKQKILIEQVDEMLDLDVVEPCESSWQSPVLIVMKKSGQPHFV